ncbi:MAG TPA: ATP-binding protein [Thermoleophilaceae bacterium]|nr:ATP-binding protein [Thermoleophilaceae bacterium]
MAEVVERNLELGPTAPAAARRLVGDITLDADARAKLELILSELVTNSVVHAGDERDAELRVRLRRESERVRGEVCGDGPEFEWAPHDPDLEEPGGLGLMIVDQLSERWGIHHNSQVCVWFECSDCGPA